MSRPIVLSNGSMLIGINRYGLVHDFYYPYVGLENHDTARNLRHRVGIWIDGQFSWMDDDSWKIDLNYDGAALVSLITAQHDKLQVKLVFHDTVDHDHDVFMRQIEVHNLADQPRSIRLMLHQVFKISNSLNGDTGQFLPGTPAILHYKGNRNFIVRTRADDGSSFDQYSIGLTGIEGKEGTYMDAEDGELQGNAVEHGSVDSVVRSCLEVAANGSRSVEYWVSAGITREGALVQSDIVQGSSVTERLNQCKQFWQEWLLPTQEITGHMPPDQAERFRKSLLLVKAHIDRRGGVIASSDTQMLNYARDAYAYCWPRDSAYALWPLLRLGYRTEVVNFFEFCRLGIQASGYLMHKYQPDAAVGSSWHPYLTHGHPEPPIQEDETAAVIVLMREYFRATDDVVVLKRYYTTLIRPMAQFLTNYVDTHTGLPHASYDLWEERFGIFTYTTAVTHAALWAASELADAIGEAQDCIKWQVASEEMKAAARKQLFNKDANYFYKSLTQGGVDPDVTIDSSAAYAAWMYGLYASDDDQLKRSIETLKATFKVDEINFKGVPRYVNDPYHLENKKDLGNPWFVTSLWLAQYHIQSGNLGKAEPIIKWVESLMMPSGVLAEQVSPDNSKSLSVAPLVWSQAEYANTLIDLYSAKQKPQAGQTVRQVSWTKPRA